MNSNTNQTKNSSFSVKVISPFLCSFVAIGFIVCLYYVFSYRSVGAIFALALVMLLGVCFYSFQVGADKSGVSIYYGLGLLSYHVDVGQIESVKIGKNGGVGGFLYNTLGTEAAVILMRDGTSYFIPLKDPRALIRAVEPKR
jgi:hypothetical protein